jgi:hypothetical protein
MEEGSCDIVKIRGRGAGKEGRKRRETWMETAASSSARGLSHAFTACSTAGNKREYHMQTMLCHAVLCRYRPNPLGNPRRQYY